MPWQIFHWGAFHWSAFHWGAVNWIAGSLLALAWFSRLVDAALVCRASPTSRDRSGTAVPRLQPANQSQHHRSGAQRGRRYSRNAGAPARPRLLELRSDRRQRPLDRPYRSDHRRRGRKSEAHGLLKAIHIPDLPSGWLGKTTPCGRRPSRQLGLGCCSPTPTYSLSPMPCAALLPMPKLSALTTLSFSRE